ncbi:hypothetical protein H0X10_02020 [Candidatus Saccharibacteria bacterium]|nr:hypothetical protein [Candidatus Saccharibacteria bacterium]
METAELSPSEALATVTSTSGNGVYASADTLFKGAVFGRDSLEVAEDLLATRRELVGSIILTLAGLQGTRDNHINEEEIGKIVHEYRTVVVDGEPIDSTSQLIFDELASRWGGEDDRLAYYGSIDATPHFIRVVDKYCEHYGDQILDETVIRPDGTEVSVRDVLHGATDWLTTKIEDSSSGLLEYQRRNSQGIENQVWKDSREFYVHTDGQLANHKAPIASIEVQGLAYDAFIAASKHATPEQAWNLRNSAFALRDRTVELLWQPDKNYFALGIDHDEQGNMRIIETKTANPAALLDSAIFDELEPIQKQTYLEAITRTIMSPDFLTDAGIRSRALSQANLIPFWDYHGSYVSWPKETYDIAKGLRRQGLPNLARQLENRLVNSVRKSNGYPEFMYVAADGRALLGKSAQTEHADIVYIDSTNNPERIQAWTVSAVVSILNERAKHAETLVFSSYPELESELLSEFVNLELVEDNIELGKIYPDVVYQLVKKQSSHSNNFVHNKLHEAVA